MQNDAKQIHLYSVDSRYELISGVELLKLSVHREKKNYFALNSRAILAVILKNNTK